MSNNSTQQDFEISNPLLVEYIILSETKKDKNPIIELYIHAGEYRQLTLAPYQFKELVQIGINPNDLIKGETYHTRFYAFWEEGEKVNGNGNPYKNVTHLEAIPSRTEQIMIDSLQLQNDLLTLIAIDQYGSSEALTAAYQDLKKRRKNRTKPTIKETR